MGLLVCRQHGVGVVAAGDEIPRHAQISVGRQVFMGQIHAAVDHQHLHALALETHAVHGRDIQVITAAVGPGVGMRLEIAVGVIQTPLKAVKRLALTGLAGIGARFRAIARHRQSGLGRHSHRAASLQRQQCQRTDRSHHRAKPKRAVVFHDLERTKRPN